MRVQAGRPVERIRMIGFNRLALLLDRELGARGGSEDGEDE
jgi:hypothetical protein